MLGCSSTPAAAAKMQAKPIASVRLGRSPMSQAEPTTPTTGTSSEPSDAVVAGELPAPKSVAADLKEVANEGAPADLAAKAPIDS